MEWKPPTQAVSRRLSAIQPVDVVFVLWLRLFGADSAAKA